MSVVTPSMNPSRDVWDEHWRALQRTNAGFGRLASFVRRTLLSRAVRHYAGRYFPPAGIFVECGSGTGQSSGRLPVGDRKYVALDLSGEALVAGRLIDRFKGFVQADLFRLPFADGSLSGVWNLGVMEHFRPEEGLTILCEIRRALAAGGVALLFWPPELGLTRLVLGPLEWVVSRIRRSPFQWFPDEVNRLHTRQQAREILLEAGLSPVAVDWTPRDLFIHVVVVARRPT